MCNVYKTKSKKGAQKLEAEVSDAIERLPSKLVRRSGKGVVVRQQADDFIPSSMRWGFNRGFSNSINNARSDNLKSSVWAEAFESRRCLVPMSVFYEWKPMPFGKKQAHAFQHQDDDWLWVAGLWEESDEHGLCYATITTEPSSLVEPIHDRMLAIVGLQQGLNFIRGGKLEFAPYQGPLVVDACDSPLKKQGPDEGLQGELF